MPTGATGEEEIITGPKPGEETLADDLNNRREVTGEMLMGGHPNDEPEAEGGGAPAGSEEKVEAGETKKEPGETLTEPPEKKEPAGPRFKSQEEAEKAHAEAERKMHEATTKASEEAKAREKLETELAELRAKPPEKKEEPVKQPTEEELDAQLESVAQAANEQAMAEIAELDDQDPDYRKLVAKAWAKANAKIIKAASASKATLSQADIDKLIDQRMDARDTAAKTAKAEEDVRTAGQKAWEQAVSFGTEAGLNLKDEESADHDLFMVAESKLPKELQNQGFTKEVGEWMVNYVRTRTGKVALTEAEKEEAARQAQLNNQPLGKGGVKPKPSTPKQETEGSLASDFEDARKARIL
jgi:hypothetical protein